MKGEIKGTGPCKEVVPEGRQGGAFWGLGYTRLERRRGKFSSEAGEKVPHQMVITVSPKLSISGMSLHIV